MIYGLEVYRPGVGWLQGEPERIILSPGDVLRISISVPYRGPAATYTLYSSIGQRGLFGFDEILSARSALSCPESPDEYVAVTGEVDIEIVSSGFSGISSGVNYDLYVKIEESPDIAAEIDNIIDIEGETSTSSITDILPMMMPLLMMGMVLPMMSGGMEE
ncbi:MAG: hypothetical protein JW712_08045 [Dehalococcoidales bacterium]|nr:hypothetical protein [Dehalococcoidales bacterium]